MFTSVVDRKNKLASGTRVSFEQQENRIVSLLLYLSTEQEEENVYLFTFVTIVDMLIYYGTREHSGDSYLQLGCLLFEYVNPASII